MHTLVLTHRTRSTQPSSRLQKSALAVAMSLPLTFGAGAVLASDMEKQKDHAYQDDVKYTYSEAKLSAKEYWSDFKQDSEQTWGSSKEAFRDGWVEGKLETALILNEHLNPFEIDIEVDQATATLSGEVGSDIDKELAGSIALGIEGIDKVQNKLAVVEDMQQSSQQAANNSEGSDFAQYVGDLTTTTAIKTELLTSDNVSGMDVDVDTNNDVVTLSGTVASEKQRELAENIAKNQDDVVKVVNNLSVSSAASQS